MSGREKRNLLFCQEEADWQRNYKNQSVKRQDYKGILSQKIRPAGHSEQSVNHCQILPFMMFSNLALLIG